MPWSKSRFGIPIGVVAERKVSKQLQIQELILQIHDEFSQMSESTCQSSCVIDDVI